MSTGAEHPFVAIAQIEIDHLVDQLSGDDLALRELLTTIAHGYMRRVREACT